MAEFDKDILKKIKLPNVEFSSVKEKAASILDKNPDMREKASHAVETLSSKAVEIKDSALELKEDIADKLTELDRMLEQSITDYNDAYTIMNDKGIQLYVERCRSSDLITFIESLINSIANHPKTFDSDFETIQLNRSKFINSCEFANQELQAAREAAGGAGAGLAAGASVAFMAPTAAMWVATTFGTASTGAAISPDRASLSSQSSIF